MKREVYEKARRLDLKMREKEKERDNIRLALQDCNNCALLVCDKSFDLDEFLGKDVLTRKLEAVEDELIELRIKFDRL